MVACTEHGASVFRETKGTRAMGIFSKDIKTMDDLFVHQLQDIYYAEKSKMADKATDQQLK
jgi:hypothetical protein